MRRVACQPSISPKATSIRMRSGFSETDMATPEMPSGALQTVKPRRCNRLVSMSRFSKLSSTSNIFLARGAGLLWCARWLILVPCSVANALMLPKLFSFDDAVAWSGIGVAGVLQAALKE